MNTADQLKKLIIKGLEEKKAENIVTLSLSDNIPLAKYMIFASGRSVKNVKAIAEHIALQLKTKSNCTVQIEGLANSDWVLIDVGDIIIHIFHPQTRERFKLEELWQERQ